MEVVGLLVAADRVHVGIEALAHGEPVTAERVALPFGERLDDLSLSSAEGGDVERDGALDAVEVVVQTRGGIHEQRRGHAQEVESLCEAALEVVLDALDRDLRLMQSELGAVCCGDDEMVHVPSLRWKRLVPRIVAALCFPSVTERDN